MVLSEQDSQVSGPWHTILQNKYKDPYGAVLYELVEERRLGRVDVLVGSLIGIPIFIVVLVFVCACQANKAKRENCESWRPISESSLIITLSVSPKNTHNWHHITDLKGQAMGVFCEL